MNKNSSQTINEYDNISVSNPSLITAGLPSGSIMTAQLIHPSSKIKQNHHFNQNRATNTQPISLTSQKNDHSQNTILSHRTVSDTYLNLSRKDIDDLMTALDTLAQYVQNDINQQDKISIDDKESHPLTMLYSKSTNHTLKSSSHHHPRYSIRHRRHSLSSNRCLNHHHYDIKHHLNLVEEFQHDLYHMKRKQERHILRQLQYYQKYFNHHHLSSHPSYSSNAILYTSTCQSNLRPKQTYHCSRQYQSTIKIPSEDRYQQSIEKKLSSSIPLSSYILDKLIYIDQNESISNVQMLPLQAHTLQILQNNHIQHSLMSCDSLSTKDLLCTALKPCYLQKINSNQISGMGDQLNLNKIDVATQWSLQMLTPKYNDMNVSKSDSSFKCQDDQENPTILTELSQSIATIPTNHSKLNIPLISKTHSIVNKSSLINDSCNIKLNNDTNEMCLETSSVNRNDEHDSTNSETERFLTTFNIPTCKCLTKQRQTINTNLKHSSIDETITCISLDNDSSFGSSLEKKKTKQIPIKCASKRSRHYPSKSSKNNQTIKRSRLDHHSQSNNQLMTVIQSYKTIDPQDDSSFDFFDIDTTFSDTYDRLFTYTTTSEKSSYMKHID